MKHRKQAPGQKGEFSDALKRIMDNVESALEDDYGDDLIPTHKRLLDGAKALRRC